MTDCANAFQSYAQCTPACSLLSTLLRYHFILNSHLILKARQLNVQREVARCFLGVRRTLYQRLFGVIPSPPYDMLKFVDQVLRPAIIQIQRLRCTEAPLQLVLVLSPRTPALRTKPLAQAGGSYKGSERYSIAGSAVRNER